jgi:hypothetical protein
MTLIPDEFIRMTLLELQPQRTRFVIGDNGQDRCVAQFVERGKDPRMAIPRRERSQVEAPRGSDRIHYSLSL